MIVIMEHVARDGSYKIVHECTLPYTGRRRRTAHHHRPRRPGRHRRWAARLIELAPGVSEDEIRSKTEPTII